LRITVQAAREQSAGVCAEPAYLSLK